MKKLTKEELVDGLELCFISIAYKLGTKLEIKVQDSKVRASSSIKPADGCDIILDGGSTCSRYIFEIGGTENILGISNSEHSLIHYNAHRVYCYCLPENLFKVKEILRREFLKQLNKAQEKIFLIAYQMKQDYKGEKLCK